MSDEIRVTLVATGLGKAGVELKAVPEPQVNDRLRPVEIEQPRVAMGGGHATPSYDNQQHQQQATGTDGSYLDIPAFLRNQAD